MFKIIYALTSLSLDELIENLKVHEMIIKKDSEIVKDKGERKSLALKAKKESSDEECSTFNSGDEEYAMAVKDFKKFFKRRECPKPLKDKNQRAFVRGSWIDSGEEYDEKANDETCLVWIKQKSQGNGQKPGKHEHEERKNTKEAGDSKPKECRVDVKKAQEEVGICKEVTQRTSTNVTSMDCQLGNPYLNRYGYVKYYKKTVKNGQKRTRERMSDQEAKEIKAEAREIMPQPSTVNCS
ncbi:hypothetical protein Tco_0799948 [Tanacetum coccineum]|uniref:Uncharacterized protein n=1 Tax=Tanacetum coccineum TaxID=301880 RepID=A0ABQ4ZVH0_9ASTR